MTEEQMRAEFEAAYVAAYPVSVVVVSDMFDREPDGEYVRPTTQAGWRMWQAARAKPDSQSLVDNMCALSVWWNHNRARFTTPKQAAFAAWNDSFKRLRGA